METKELGSVVVAQAGDAAEQEAKNLTEDNEFVLYVGDYIEFTAGPRVGTKGKIYYLDEDLLRVLPDGASDRLIDIDTSIFADETTEIERDPTSLYTFVEIADLKDGNAVQTFDDKGTPIAAYKVTNINLEEDSVVLVGIDENGAELGDELALQFTEGGRVVGIPLDAPFAVLRAQELPKPATAEDNTPQQEEEVEIDLEDVVDEPEPEEDEVIRERKPEEVIYDDLEQKNDFIENERAVLKPAQRTNARLLQQIRRLMENCFQLRNDILEYKESGEVARKAVAYDTLANLLEQTPFPLAKKVLGVYKTLYVDHSPAALKGKKEETEETIDFAKKTEDGTLDIEYLEDAVNGGIEFLQQEFSRSGDVGKLATQQRPRLYQVFQAFYNLYFAVMGPLDSISQSIQTTEYDTDFFRINPLKDGNPALRGFQKVGKADDFVNVDGIKDIELSYMRTLKPRIGKYGDRKVKLKGVIEEGDEVEVWKFVLFPFLFLRDLGSIRSGKLSLDIANGMSPPKTMQMILEEKGGVKEEPNPKDIFAVDANNSIAANIELKDWLKGQALYGNGIGDLLPYLKSIGLSDSEFTPEQAAILQEKIKYYQANLKKFLFDTRKQANEIIRNPEPILNFSFLSEENQRAFLDALVLQEKILFDKVQEFQYQYPSWKNNDLGIFSYLYTHFPDYVLAALSGIPANFTSERLRTVKDMFLQRLHESILYQQKLKQQGDEPVVNECDHVENLKKIRQVDNDDDRIRLMVQKFLPMFQGKTEDHWLFCKVCKGHLLCEHEYLMILEKTFPNQKDVIHKKILLTFSDGVFNGKFICGNCGQGIQDLEFDQSMEFDDEGRPMMGNEPITQEMETTLAKELDRLLEIKGNDLTTVKGETGSNEGEIGSLANEIANTLGVALSISATERIIRLVERGVNKRSYKDQKTYLAQIETDKKVAQVKKVYDTYEQYVAQGFISNVAGAVLIEIQSAVPDYTIRGVVSGCANPTFDGYPLNPSEDEINGVNYVACALANLSKNEKPWSETKWPAIAPTKSDGLKTRITTILKTLAATIQKMAADAEAQIMLAKKREFMKKEGVALFGRYADEIPPAFLPLPIVLNKEQLANAEAPTVGEAAPPSQKAYAWILEGHKLARTKGIYEKGNPLSEASCCYSSLESPMKFWSEQTLPVLNPKEPPRGPRGNLLTLKMKVREPELLLGEPNANLMYRLFLRVCFPREGIVNPRVGLPHEPGYNNKCPYCQFEFPTDPRMPPPELSYSKDKKAQALYDEQYETEVQNLYQADIAALQEAGAIEGQTVERKTFESLLQETNNHFLVPIPPVKSVALGMETLNGLASLSPEPFDGFSELITNLVTSLSELPPDPDKADILTVYGPISGKMSEFKNSLEEFFKTKIPKAERDSAIREFNHLWDSPPQTLGELLRTFLLLPLQRSRFADFEPTSISLSKRTAIYEKIGKDEKDKLKEYLKVHMDRVPAIKNLVDKSNKKEQVEEAIGILIEKLIIVIPLYIKVLRTNVIPFGSYGLPYLQRSILVGILWEFVNLNGDGSKSDTGFILSTCLAKGQQSDENTIKTPDEIRKLITSRNESEKMEIINDLDKLTPEAKRAELAMKSLGLGRWARGASKGIFSYDEEQQAFEAAERVRRGITDFYGLTPAEQEVRDRQAEADGGGYDNYANDGDEE